MVTPDRYLSLVKKALVNELYIEAEALIAYLLFCAARGEKADTRALIRIQDLPGAIEVVRHGKSIGRVMSITSRGPNGRVIPHFELRGALEVAHTMIGRARIDNLHDCLDRIAADGIPGDLIQTGVWRGGATIFMRAWLMAHGITDRIVWVADSFDGLPPPTLKQDEGVDLSKNTTPFLAVPRAEVEALFARYDLLDNQVRFLQGWFRDTLPSAPIERLALLRLDGDLYESTMDALQALYHKVSPGGFVIVDDYYTNPTCAAAITDFRAVRAITAPTVNIDRDALYWRVP